MHAAILERIRHGRSTVVLGGMPELPETISVVRVRCDLPGPLTPLERASKRIERLLDGPQPSQHDVVEECARPLRERFVIACNRLADHAPGHAVLVLDAADAADASTHQLVAQLLRAPAKLRLPLLLVVRHETPESFRPIVDALEDQGRASTASLVDRLDRVGRLVGQGDMKSASAELGGVLDALSLLPAGTETSLIAGRALLERARIRWLGAGIDPDFTLDGALEAALEARAVLGRAAPARVCADIAAVIAGIAYDLGDGASIERAAEIVADTMDDLMTARAPGEAAMLLNDQAALELRVGRRKKARDLAERSLALLRGRVEDAPDDRTASADLTATHHLLARMPLHGSVEDVTPAALASAMDHVTRAEAGFRALGMKRETGRALETFARLEALAGNEAGARVRFEAAMQLANECADLTGLARITAGLAELFADAGRPRDALGLLASSIELNREKASPVGLAFDERALAHIEDVIAAAGVPDVELVNDLARTRDRLERALDLDEPR